MPDSTANGITYPVPGDYVKAAEFASKLAKDFETLALTADQAIVAGVAQGIIPVLSGYVKPKPIPSGTDLLTLDTGWWYNRLTSVAGTMLNRPQGVTDGPFMVHMVRTPFGHSTITYYGYSGTAGGLFENHTGNATHTAWVGWRRLDGTTGGGITQGSGLAGFANILRTQMFRDAMGPVVTGNKGAIAFRFDHGLSKFNSIMRPLLEARGIKYSLALSARNFNAGENAGVTASMVNGWSGAEVWNHGANQHQDESSVAGLTDQIVTGLAELQAALPNKQIWGYAVPGTGGSGQGGFFGGATAEQFYETAAGDLILTNHAVSSGSMSGTSRRPLDGRIRQGMAHFTIEAQTVARIKSEIDNAISNKTGNQLMMHPNLLNTEGYLTTAQLVEVLDYVVAKRDAGDLVVLSPYEMLVAQLSTSGGSVVPGPPGAGVPAGGEALQVIRKNAFNTTTEWATLTKSLVGLSNVDNTSDMNKPVSTMQKLALDEKLDAAKLPDEVDGVNKNLIENSASLTAGALSAAIAVEGVEAVTGADEKVLFVTPRGSDANNGLTLKTAKATIGAAVASLNGVAGRVQLGFGSFTLATTVALADGQSVDGVSERGTVITYTGTGIAFTSATPGVRTYNQRLSRFRLAGPGKTSAAVGISLDSMTDATMEDVTVASFGTGVSLPSTVNGGSVYNNLRHVTVSSCGTGFKVGPMGSNSNMFFGCRANACTIGMDIEDANHVAWFGGSFEVNTTGIRVTATSNAFADANMIFGARFESNTTAWNVTSSFVRDFQVLHPSLFAAYVFIDNGTRTTHVGNFIGQNYQRSAYAGVAGTWAYERTVNGGTALPAFVVRDSVSTSGDPVTIQAETERPTGWFIRGVRGGINYWDVDASGNMRSPGGGYTELTERSADPLAPAENSLRFYAKDVGGKTALFVRFATGSPVQVAIEP